MNDQTTDSENTFHGLRFALFGLADPAFSCELVRLHRPVTQSLVKVSTETNSGRFFEIMTLEDAQRRFRPKPPLTVTAEQTTLFDVLNESHGDQA